jgi:ComF family protein
VDGLVRELVDAAFPLRCVLCRGGTEVGLFCSAHAPPAGLAGSRCVRCQARLSDALPAGSRCAECRQRAPPFARLVALGDWRSDAGLREAVLAFKHGGRVDLAWPLAVELAARVGALETGGLAGSVLVPVPLHPLRRLERGYDQAARLARALAAEGSAELARALRRVRWTPPQGSALGRSRQANVRTAFALRRSQVAALHAREVWLVDDVVTSGATARACARLLRRAGARRVGVLCLARAAGSHAHDEPAGH